MIEHIKASAAFSTPIKSWSISGEFSPPPGITAVVGRNGSGKSLLAIETPRYLMFGKKALRGAASDYKSYEAEGIFKFHGKRYQIKRGPKREQIMDLATGVVEAVGAEAVTAKVVELLGYGLEVFDLANAAVQKQTDKLGQLRPAARKALIDEVVGLANYETVAKACREEAAKLKGVADSLTKSLRLPVEPEKPQNYKQPHILDITIKRERQQRREYDRLLAAQSQPATMPQAPDVVRVSQEIVDKAVQTHAEAEATRKERARLTNITTRCMPWPGDWTEDTIATAEERYAWERAREARGPKPTLSLEEIKAGLDAWDEINMRKRMSDEQATCPECGTTFRVGGELPPEPSHPRATYLGEQKAHSWWKDPLPPEPIGPALSPGQAKELRLGLRMTQEYNEAQAALDLLPQVTNLPDLLGLRHAQAAWQAYDAGMVQFEAAVDRAQAAQQELAQWLEEHDTPLTDDDLDGLQDQLSASKLYDQAHSRYLDDRAHYEQVQLEIAENSRRADAYRDGSKALTDARAQFKAMLAPMLSRIASSLIYDMSAGELSNVIVDEDMEITVDGQRIETLSGAGETVANLALRIALGQALIADAFPVFLGDEIDSDADEQRREATKLALLKLKDRLSQIILITHRAVDIADLVVDLDITQ